MFGVRIFLIALVATAEATSDSPFCSRSFNEVEWQEEAASYLLNVKELQQYLQPEPYFLSKILLLATGKPQSLLELAGTALAKAVPLNGSYLSIWALVLLLMLAFYFLRRKHELGQVPFLGRLLAEKALPIKCLKMGMMLLLAVGAVYCLKGIDEGSRQEKVINHLLCRMLNNQRFIQKNNTYISHTELFNYVYQLSQRFNGDNFKETRSLLLKLRISEHPKKIIQEISRILQSEGYNQSSMLQQLHNANKTLTFLSNFMIKSYSNFEDKCGRNSILFFFDVFKFTQIVDKLINAVKGGNIKDLKAGWLPTTAAALGKAYYFIIFCFLVVAGALISRKNNCQHHSLTLLDRLQFILLVIIILCFITIIATTLFLSFNFWIYQAEKLIINDPLLCYDQFSVLVYKQTMGFCRLLAPEAKNVAKSLYLSPFTSKVCQNYYDQFNQIARPYFAKRDSYFSDLMASSATAIRNEVVRGEIVEKITARNAKAPLVPIMKSMHEHLANFLQIEEEIEQQNINFTVFLEDLVQLLATHTANRAKEIRQLCKALSITLGLVLLLSNVTKWLVKDQKGCLQKITSQNEGSTELTDIDLEASIQ